MPDKRRIFLDTSIFMYARGKEHPLKAPCSKIILQIGDTGEIGTYGSPVINTEVFQEILYRYSMIGKRETGISVCRDIKALGTDILPVAPGDVDYIIDLFEKYKKKNIPPRDLIHSAVMLNNSVSRIITTDKHFDSIKEVTCISPEKILF